MINILLVDDHELVRTGIKLMLQDTDQIQVVGEASSGEEAVLSAKENKPDVILMDVNMPGIGGLEATIRLLRSDPHIKVLVLSTHTDEILPSRLMSIGAAGYLSKHTNREELLKAIHAVHSGQFYIDPSMMDLIVLPRLNPKDSSDASISELSERELQILLMVARGMEVNEIAQKLFLSTKTINGYRNTILKKLGVKTDVEAARIAIRLGLVDVDSQWH
jgi:two-component system invasion response regulator UvrY